MFQNTIKGTYICQIQIVDTVNDRNLLFYIFIFQALQEVVVLNGRVGYGSLHLFDVSKCA